MSVFLLLLAISTIGYASSLDDNLIEAAKLGDDTSVKTGTDFDFRSNTNPVRQEGGTIIMATYITLVNYTEKGIAHIKESPARLEKVKEAMRAAGGEFKAFYLTMGRYDIVVISEAPNDEAYAATMLAIGAAGAVRSETLKAFTEEEYKKIIAAIP